MVEGANKQFEAWTSAIPNLAVNCSRILIISKLFSGKLLRLSATNQLVFILMLQDLEVDDCLHNYREQGGYGFCPIVIDGMELFFLRHWMH